MQIVESNHIVLNLSCQKVLLALAEGWRHLVALLQLLQRCSSTRTAPLERSSADGVAMAAMAVVSLPQASQGGLSTCATEVQGSQIRKGGLACMREQIRAEQYQKIKIK